MGRTQLEIALAQLKKEIEKCEDYKKRVLNYVENVKDKCLSDDNNLLFNFIYLI